MYTSRLLSGTSSPLPEPATSSKRRANRLEISRLTKLARYLSRLFKFSQMDFESAGWQMIYLFIAPKKVFRLMCYRKQTKNQYSRDDPAFLVLLSVWFVISASGLSLVLSLPFYSFIKFLLWVVLIDCVGFGLLVASFFWISVNKYMRDRIDEQVEWAYCFDVHLNAFFPPLLILHVLQLFFYSVLINHDRFLSRLFGNSLFMIALGYYFYITFIGYSSLRYLRKTQIFLYPLVFFAFVYLITLIAGFNWCQSMMNFYEYRIYY